MKELITKIRHWLIKRLGGYTEQYTNNRSVLIGTHRFKPIRLRSMMFVDDYSLCRTLSEQEILDRVKRIKLDMAYQIADKLIENDLILIHCYDDPIQYQRKYIAELNVIPPDDAVMRVS